MARKIRAFLFDLDGVLIDSESKYTEIWQTIERHHPTGVPDFAHKIKGTTLPDILDRYFPNPEVRKDVERMLYDLEGRMAYEYCPGAQELLGRLQARGIPTALVTSSDSAKMAHLWAQHPEMKSYFNAIVTSEDVSNSKPHPEPYLTAAKRLGVEPAECVVVEDSLQGLRSGRAANALTIGIIGTLAAPTIVEESDAAIHHLDTLLSLISIYE